MTSIQKYNKHLLRRGLTAGSDVVCIVRCASSLSAASVIHLPTVSAVETEGLVRRQLIFTYSVRDMGWRVCDADYVTHYIDGHHWVCSSLTYLLCHLIRVSLATPRDSAWRACDSGRPSLWRQACHKDAREICSASEHWWQPAAEQAGVERDPNVLPCLYRNIYHAEDTEHEVRSQVTRWGHRSPGEVTSYLMPPCSFWNKLLVHWIQVATELDVKEMLM